MPLAAPPPPAAAEGREEGGEEGGAGGGLKTIRAAMGVGRGDGGREGARECRSAAAGAAELQPRSARALAAFRSSVYFGGRC